MLGVRAIAYWPETVQGCRVLARRVAVRSAPGSRCAELEPELFPDRPGLLPERNIARCRLHRWPADAAFDVQPHARSGRFDAMDRAFYGVACLDRGHTHVDDRGAVRCDDVRVDAAIDRTHIDRDAIVRVVEREHRLDDV